jgi:hypothetical protein
MTAKPKPAPAEVPAHPLPVRGGCYLVQDGELTPETTEPAFEADPVNTPSKEA